MSANYLLWLHMKTEKMEVISQVDLMVAYIKNLILTLFTIIDISAQYWDYGSYFI